MGKGLAGWLGGGGCSNHRVPIGVEKKNGECISALSDGAYTTTLLVMVDRVKSGKGVHPPPSPGWADFTIMMECTTPESGHCHSLCVLLCGSDNHFC